MLVVMAFGGCSCSDPAVTTRPGEAKLEPQALNFGEVCNETPHDSTFTLTNIGGGALNAELKIVGADAVFFTVDPASISLPANRSATIHVRYTPNDDAAGGSSQLGRRHIAQVEVAYTGEKDAAVTKTVEVVGEVSDNEVAPQVSYVCGTKEDGSPLPRCEQGIAEPCCNPRDNADGTKDWTGLGFGQPRAGSTATLPLQVRNLGCGDLEISSVTLTPVPGASECDASTARIVGLGTPATVPGGLGDGQGQDFSLEFNAPERCTYLGNLKFTTTDPNRSTFEVLVGGAAREPNLVTSTDLLQFGEVAPGNTAQQEFAVRNTGSFAIAVQSVALSAATSPDYTIVKIEKDSCNGNAPANARTPISIDGGYTLAATNSIANCGDDEFFVTVRYAPTTPANQDTGAVEIQSADGMVPVRLAGGTAPQIITNPDGIDFGMPAAPLCTGGDSYSCDRSNGCAGVCTTNSDCPGSETCYGGTCISSATCALTCGTASKTIEVCNEGLASLNITDVFLTSLDGGSAPVDSAGGYPIFKVGEDNCSDTAIAQDQCCTVTVDFQDKNHGGGSNAYLNIVSDDPANPTYKVNVVAFTKPDARPVATFTANPSVPQVDQWVTLDARGSTDTEGAIATYAWTLVSFTGATNLPIGDIDPAAQNAGCNRGDGQCFEFPFAPNNTSVLRFHPDVSGGYVFEVRVTDQTCNPPHEARFSTTVQVTNVTGGN